MSNTLSIRAAALVALVAAPAVGQPADPGTAVRQVFAAKCAVCHGPDLTNPRGRFGYVLDLRRVADNPELVIPGRPEESELWQLVSRAEMPPPDSPAGPLTATQKELVRDWIAAGAPAGSAGGLSPPDATSPETPEPDPPSVWYRLQVQIGFAHLLVLHFPIALLLSAAVGEAWFALRRRRSPAAAVHFCVRLGAAGAVAAAALGWVFAGTGHGAGQSVTLSLHRWLGTSAAAWAVVTAAVSVREQRTGVRTWWFRACLTAGAVLVAAAAHFGGVLVHGTN